MGNWRASSRYLAAEDTEVQNAGLFEIIHSDVTSLPLGPGVGVDVGVFVGRPASVALATACLVATAGSPIALAVAVTLCVGVDE